MRLTFQLLLAMALLPAAMTQTAGAQGAAAPIHVATYVEVAVASEKDGAKLLTGGKRVGDQTEFSGGILVKTTIQPLPGAKR